MMRLRIAAKIGEANKPLHRPVNQLTAGWQNCIGGIQPAGFTSCAGNVIKRFQPLQLTFPSVKRTALLPTFT